MTLFFSRLEVNDWRQFSKVDIAFDSRVTIITGRNASGKTTLLRLLDQHFPFGRQDQFVSTPVKKDGQITFSSDARWKFPGVGSDYGNDIPIGRVSFSEGNPSVLTVPKSPNAWYQVTSQHMQQVTGFPIHSSRGGAYYPRVDNVGFAPLVPEEMFEKTVTDLLQFPPNQTDPMHGLHITRKKAILNSFVNGILRPDSGNRSGQIVGAFEEAMRALLPKDLGFEAFDIIENEVIMVTKYGSFSMDSMSGGTGLIADIVWLIESTNWKYEHIVVTIDEPENHMHPGLQQTLLPRLVEFFTQPYFIVATHSPHVVTSVKDANVFALQRDDDGRVSSTKLDDFQKSATANETLRNVLELEHTKPLWASNELNKILHKYTSKAVTAESLSAMRTELVEAGLSDYTLDAATEAIFPEGKEEGRSEKN